MTDFDPAQHRMVQRTALVRGFRARRTFRDSEPDPDLGGIRRVPDRQRRHPSDPLRRRILPRPRHAGLLAHGFQTLVHTAPGAGLFPYIVEESLIGFLEQSSKFLKPVYAGDTIYPALEVIELVPGRTTGVVTLRSTVFNQRKELVLEGMQKFLVSGGGRTHKSPKLPRRKLQKRPKIKAFRQSWAA